MSSEILTTMQRNLEIVGWWSSAPLWSHAPLQAVRVQLMKMRQSN